MKLLKKIFRKLGNWPLPVFLKRGFWRLAGFSVGAGVKFGRNVILACDNAKIGRYTEISRGVEARGLEELKIGEYTVISDRTLLFGDSKLEFGDNCFVGVDAIVNASAPVSVGDNVALAGAGVQVWTHSTWPEVVEGFGFKFAPVTIGKDTYIGTGTIILPGVKIGKGVVVGAGAVVTKDLPDGVLAMGVPAKPLGRHKGKAMNQKQVAEVTEKFLMDQGFNDFSFHPDVSGKVVFTFGDLPGIKGSLFDLKNKVCRINNREGVKARKLLNQYVARFREDEK